MSPETAMGLIGALGAMILVGSGLAQRRLPGLQWLTMAIAWAGIILLVWAAATIISRRL